MRRLAILLLALTSWGSTTIAAACRDTDLLRNALVGRYGEVEVYSAVTTEGQLLQFFINPKTRTWSQVMSYPNNVSCLIRSGDGWSGPMIVREEHHAEAG